MSTKAEIIEKLKATTAANGDRPLSSRAFFKTTGLSPRDLHRAGWPTHGSLLQSQGFQPAGMRRGYTDDQLFRPLAELMTTLGHFPTQSEREVERHREPSFPSSEAYHRRARGGNLESAFREWCQKTGNYSQLLTTLRPPIHLTQSTRPITKGYVYMIRSGRRFKIGRESTEGARQAAAGTWPENPKVIHRIATDDPEGVEGYWHDRFKKQGKHLKNELFGLSAADVAAFKANPFLGRWRIFEMEQWDRDYIDLVVPGYIKFGKDGLGYFQFGTVQGELDFRLGAEGAENRIEFSWQGQNDNNEGCGRGWAELRDGQLSLRQAIHPPRRRFLVQGQEVSTSLLRLRPNHAFNRTRR